MKREWPQKWPDALQLVLNDPTNSVSAMIICQLADAVGEETKDLPIKRRKEIIKQLAQLQSQMFGCIQKYPQLVDQVQWIKAFTPIYGLPPLLANKVDVFLFQQLTSNDHTIRDEILLVLAEWYVQFL